MYQEAYSKKGIAADFFDTLAREVADVPYDVLVKARGVSDADLR